MTKFEELQLGLLGRIAYPEERLRAVVTRNKRNPEGYVTGYNVCDGKHTVGQIAKVVGVSPGTLVPILQEWERLGIIFEQETGERGKYYRHLYPLEE